MTNPISEARRRLVNASRVAQAMLIPERPDRMARALAGALPFGPTLVGGLAAATARYPDATAVRDDEGDITYRELWRASDALARGMLARGIGPGITVGILARNHRGFVIAMVAASKLGADIVFLNTGFAAPQLADVASAEGITAVIHDDEFASIVAAAGLPIAISESDAAALVATAVVVPVPPTRRQGRMVILTSGTTGRPKGARRSGTGGLTSVVALLATIPLRARDTVLVAAPLFHAWGLSHLGLGLSLSSTIVLQRRFEPGATIAAVAHDRADGLVLVPAMLQRILGIDDGELARHDTSSLRYLALSGSALGAALATAAMERFGPILYNVYGSTEVALATIAGPADLRAAPATAGRPAPGSIVRVLDERGHEVPAGIVGRIFVRSGARFDGYTGGGGKETIDGLLSTGDIGHIDDDGRLFIDGRDDDMIVSGGENVFPAEIEDLIAGHPAVADAAVVGVPDEEFGQRLRAYVVVLAGRTVTEQEIRDLVRSNLARFKVPREVVFTDELPRTTTGKLRRRDLS